MVPVHRISGLAALHDTFNVVVCPIAREQDPIQDDRAHQLYSLRLNKGDGHAEP
jgi:hypothetical protein